MTVQSAGLLAYRRVDGEIEVLLGHMGGPFWVKKDAGAWTIPKGELEPGEEPLAGALREFGEELGLPVPRGRLIDLGTIRQSRKTVHAWAIDHDLDPADVVPGTFLMVWPPKSGTEREFPELDRVRWFGLDEARSMIIAGQRELLTRLTEALSDG